MISRNSVLKRASIPYLTVVFAISVLWSVSCSSDKDKNGGKDDITVKTDEVASVEIAPAYQGLALDESTTLTAVAKNAEGEVIEDAPIQFLTGAGDRLDVSAEGVVIGNSPGLYNVTASSGQAVSEAAYIMVFDPREREKAQVSGEISRPVGYETRDIQVIGTAGAMFVGADNTFTVECLAHRNQLLIAVDPENDALIWLGLAAGDSDDSVTLDAASTAEALVYLLPGLAGPDPAQLEAFRERVADHPGMAELAFTIDSLASIGQRWTEHFEAIAADIDIVLTRIVSEIEAAAAPPAPGGDSLPDFAPVSIPSLGSGINVDPQATSGRLADLLIRNSHVRQVDLYLEVNPKDGSRPDEAQGPYQMGGMTGVLPSISQWLFGNMPMERSEMTIKNVNFDPETGGSRRYRLFAYGIGVEERNREVIEREKLAARLAPVVIRGFILDYVLNILSLASSIGLEDIGKLVVGSTTQLMGKLLASTAFNHLVTAICDGQATIDDVVAVFDCLIGVVVEWLKSPEGVSFIKQMLAAVGKTATKEAVEKFLFPLEIYSAFSAMSTLIGTVYSLFNSAWLEVFNIDDVDGEIEPGGEQPDAFETCPYEIELMVIGAEGPFTWVIDDLDPPKLTLEPIDPPEYRRARLFTDAWEPGGFMPFYVEVYEPMYPDEPGSEELRYVDRTYLSFRSKKPAPVITGVTFPNGTKADPGGQLNISGTVTHCAGADKIAKAEASGPALEGVANLNFGPATGDSRSFSGVITIRNPQQDEPDTPDIETVTVTVSDSKGAGSSKRESIDVDNVAPSIATGKAAAYVVKPGDVFTMTVETQDDNFDGTKKEILTGSVRVSHPGGLKTVKPLDTIDFGVESSDATTGKIVYVAKKEAEIRLPHADNDGTTKSFDDDNPFDGEVDLIDNNKKHPSQTHPVRIVVTNVAPVIVSLTADPPVLPEKEVVTPRPLTLTVVVKDDNGFDDIGAVVLDLSALGFEADTILDKPESTDKDAGTATYKWRIDDVPNSCKNGCTVLAVAFDADDGDDNGRASEQADVIILEENRPPKILGDAMVEWIEGPTGGGHCPGQNERFGVMAMDDNRDNLAADLILNGTRKPMPGVRRDKTWSWTRDLNAGPPGTYSYYFEVRETSVALNPYTVTTGVETFEVEDCSEPSDTSLCDPDLQEEEVCDGIDNDCNGEVDDGLVDACPSAILHSGEFRVGGLPLCPGDPLVYQVVVGGDDHPYPVRVEWTGPETGSHALSTELTSDDDSTGYYRAEIPAPGTPGLYDIAFYSQVPELSFEMSHKLRVDNCCDLADAEEAVELGTGGQHVAMSEDGMVAWTQGAEGSGGAGIYLYDTGICEGLLHPVSAVQVNAPSVSDDWVAWSDWRDVVNARAFLMDLTQLEELPVSESEVNVHEVAVSPAYLVLNDERNGAPNLHLHAIDDLDTSIQLTDNDDAFVTRWLPSFGDGYLAWLDPNGVIFVYDLETGVDAPLDLPLVVSLDASGDTIAFASESDAVYTIGTWNVVTGEMTTYETPSLIDPAPRLSGDALVWIETLAFLPNETQLLYRELVDGTTMTLAGPFEAAIPSHDVAAGFVAWRQDATVLIRPLPQ